MFHFSPSYEAAKNYSFEIETGHGASIILPDEEQAVFSHVPAIWSTGKTNLPTLPSVVLSLQADYHSSKLFATSSMIKNVVIDNGKI